MIVYIQLPYVCNVRYVHILHITCLVLSIEWNGANVIRKSDPCSVHVSSCFIHFVHFRYSFGCNRWRNLSVNPHFTLLLSIISFYILGLPSPQLGLLSSIIITVLDAISMSIQCIICIKPAHRQLTHYLGQYWPICRSRYGVAGPQWIN